LLKLEYITSVKKVQPCYSLVLTQDDFLCHMSAHGQGVLGVEHHGGDIEIDGFGYQS
jgi:hypothetical protein